jgi:hypothetical protein
MGSQYQKNLAKAAAVAAITLCISLGLCGLTAMSGLARTSSLMGRIGPLLAISAAAVIVLSFVALIVIGILMLFAAIFRRGDSAQ